MDAIPTTVMTKTPKVPKKKGRLLLRVALVVAGVLLGLVLLGGWLLFTESGHARLKAILVERVSEELNGRLDIATLEGGPLAWRLTGVRILDEAGAEVMGADAIEARLGWREGPVLLDARAEAPRLFLRHGEDGTLNLVALRREPPAGLPLEDRPRPPKLRIERLVIERGALRYESPAGGAGIVAFADLAGELTFDTADGRSHVAVKWLSALLAGGPVTRLAGEVTFGKRLVELTSAELRVGESVLEVKGTYVRPEGEPSRLDVDILRAQLGVPEVVRWLLGARLPEGVTLRGGVHGTASDLRVKLEVLAGAAGTASVTGTFRFGGRPAYELVLEGRGVDLNAWSSELPATRLDVDAELKGEGLAPAHADASLAIDARGEVGGLGAGKLHLPLTLHEGNVSFAGASWPEAGMVDAAGEWSPGRLALRTSEGAFSALVLRFVDVEGEVRWEYRMGAGEPERLLRWQPGAGWVAAK